MAFIRSFKWIIPIVVLMGTCLRAIFSPASTAAIEDTAFVTKTVDKPLAAVGDVLLYTVTLANPETIPLTDVIVQDEYDPRLVNIQVISAGAGQVMMEGNTLVIRQAVLQPGESAVITVAAQISDRARPGDVISSIARFESPQASLHLSNPAEVMVLPGALPATGESPWWRIPMTILIIVAWIILAAVGMDVRRRRHKF